ncbi:stalk domain-containing protein [Alphaproteobacteria bacterium]|nr:stalk domain-containing protein [Alphaproteobacteria bacterium]
MVIEETVIGQVYNRQILLSLRDFIQALNFPIQYNEETNTFAGWFIRENKTFSLDPEKRIAVVEGQEFAFSKDVLTQDNEILVPLTDLSSWFKIEFDTDIGQQKLALDPEHPLPVMEREARRKWKKRDNKVGPATLPRGDDEYDLIDVPFVDVSTQSNLADNAETGRIIRHNANIRTAGEFAYGNLTTNASFNDTDNLTNARVSYLQEHADPVLLGPLNARRFELGDLSATRLPLTGNSPQETGARITNTNPLVTQTQPTTQITGYIFPGWDVELYRNNSLISTQTTDESGLYSFDNVQLVSNRNFFKIISYGPQGEIREETLNVPFDNTREAREGSIYDISVTAQNSQFYRKQEDTDEDKNTPHIVGFIETPVGSKSALRIGARHRQEEGTQKTYANVGFSTALAQTLVNLDLAADEKGESAASLSLNRQLGKHSWRSDLDFRSEEYNPGQKGTPIGSISSSHNIEGPIPIPFGQNPNYLINTSFNRNSDDQKSFRGFLNLNTQFKSISLNQSMDYQDRTTNTQGADINGVTSVSGSIGKNRLRALANYEFKPENTLDSLAASWQRKLTPELESQLQVNRELETKRTRYSAQVNWRPDYATISPRVSYDNEGNFQALLSTRFGINRLPQTGEILFSKDPYTSTGTINAFVFLDKNGDLEFNGEDEPIENARVKTPQNSSATSKTNKNGVANLARLRANIITDVYIDPVSLEDPFWIPATEGKSLMPRTGTNIKLNLPVHLAGEMDGTVYIQKPDGGKDYARGVRVNLYSKDGNLLKETITGSDGFYIMDLVPPGDHILLVDASTLPPNSARPSPQEIKIGYNGDPIFGNDIFLQKGYTDTPSKVLASLDAIKKRHPQVDFEATDPDIILKIGSYNSNLMMALSWYNLKLRFGSVLKGGKLLVNPSQSSTDQEAKHQIRLALPDSTIQNAYKKCQLLIKNGITCEVEILPGALGKMASLSSKKL